MPAETTKDLQKACNSTSFNAAAQTPRRARHVHQRFNTGPSNNKYHQDSHSCAVRNLVAEIMLDSWLAGVRQCLGLASAPGPASGCPPRIRHLNTLAEPKTAQGTTIRPWLLPVLVPCLVSSEFAACNLAANKAPMNLMLPSYAQWNSVQFQTSSSGFCSLPVW